MSKRITCAAVLAVLAACAVWGQQNEQEGGARHPRLALGRGNWVNKRLMNQEFLNKIGVTGEQAAKLKAKTDELEKESQKVEEEITQTAMEQAELAKKVLAEPGADTDEIMALVEKIGKLRTEQAKLATRRLIVMRDNLTAEQRQKAAALLAEEQKKWREEREKAGAANQPRRPPAPKNW